MRQCLCVSMMIVCMTSSVLQRVAAAQTNDLPLPPAAKAVLDAFGKPLHPIIGSIAPGGGPAFGFGYDTPRDQDWFHNASAKMTFSRYWEVNAETGYQTHTSHVGVFGGVRHMNELDFFGVGADSIRDNQSDYRLRETSFGSRGWLRVRPDLRIGGMAQVYSPQLGSGSDPLRSIEKIFSPADVPGFDADPLFFRYRAYAEVTHRQNTYQLAAETVHDHDGGFYNFRRVEAEGRQQFRGLKPDQRLTLHGLLGITNRAAVVPYYLEYTLGGNSLGAFRPETIGTDGTKATLRGFDNYRFRDRDLLLLQVEYRVPLRKFVDATVFYDAGQVAGRVPDLFGHIKPSAGFSLSYMRGDVALARVDVGHSGSEGLHFYWTFSGFGF